MIWTHWGHQIRGKWSHMFCHTINVNLQFRRLQKKMYHRINCERFGIILTHIHKHALAVQTSRFLKA